MQNYSNILTHSHPHVAHNHRFQEWYRIDDALFFSILVDGGI